MWVQSLGREDPLEESMATHSSILAWRIPWLEEPSGLQSIRVTKRGDLAQPKTAYFMQRSHSKQSLLLRVVQHNTMQGFPDGSCLGDAS